MVYIICKSVLFSFEHFDSLVDLPVPLLDVEESLLVLLPLEPLTASVNYINHALHPLPEDTWWELVL